jgi:hypothetical protein
MKNKYNTFKIFKFLSNNQRARNTIKMCRKILERKDIKGGEVGFWCLFPSIGVVDS